MTHIRASNTATMFNGKVFQQFQCDLRGLTIANHVGKLNIPILLDNGCAFPISTKQFSHSNDILHKYFKLSTYSMVIHDRNGDCIVYFGYSLLLYIQHDAIQLQLLILETLKLEEVFFLEKMFSTKNPLLERLL